jgi:hypothetical protein
MGQITKKLGKRILLFSLVTYALFDVVRTWLQTQKTIADAVGSEISLIRSPLAMIADALLLLAATISISFARPWGYALGTAFSAWLLYRGFEKWLFICSATNLPRSSLAVFDYWIHNAQGGWDLVRFALTVVILVFSLVSFTQSKINSAA